MTDSTIDSNDPRDTATGGAGSFDARHGEFSDGAAGAGIDERTGQAVHGDGTAADGIHLTAAEEHLGDDGLDASQPADVPDTVQHDAMRAHERGDGHR